MAGRVGGLTSGLPHKEKFNNVRALTSEEARWVCKTFLNIGKHCEALLNIVNLF